MAETKWSRLNRVDIRRVVQLKNRKKGFYRQIIFQLLLKAYFKNWFYWKAPDREGFCQVILLPQTSERKNFAKSVFLRWVGVDGEKETQTTSMDAYKQRKDQTQSFRRWASSDVKHSSFFFSFALSIVLYGTLTIWTFFCFQFFERSLICRKTVTIKHSLSQKKLFYLRLITYVSHLPVCGLQTLSHDASWPNIMSLWPVYGKGNSPKTDGINLRMPECSLSRKCS